LAPDGKGLTAKEAKEGERGEPGERRREAAEPGILLEERDDAPLDRRRKADQRQSGKRKSQDAAEAHPAAAPRGERKASRLGQIAIAGEIGVERSIRRDRDGATPHGALLEGKGLVLSFPQAKGTGAVRRHQMVS
jgi:hypothetical protein